MADVGQVGAFVLDKVLLTLAEDTVRAKILRPLSIRRREGVDAPRPSVSRAYRDSIAALFTASGYTP